MKRQLDVLNRRLADSAFISGEAHTIANISISPWYGALVLGWANDVRELLSTHEHPNVQRWATERPAVQRGRLVNRKQNDWPGSLQERHDSSDFAS